MSILQDAFQEDNYAAAGAPLLKSGISKAKIKEVKDRLDKETKQPTGDIIVTFEGVDDQKGREWGWFCFESAFDESKCTEDWHFDALRKNILQVQHILSAFFDEEKVKAKFATIKTPKDVIALLKAGLSHDMAKIEAEIKLVYDGKNRLNFPKGGKNKETGKIFITNFMSTEVAPRKISINLNYDKLEPEEAPESNDDDFNTSSTVVSEDFPTPTHLADNEDPFA
jgi:hypothetical protein